MRTAVFDEFSAAAPINTAPGPAVVTASAAKVLTAVAEKAVLAGAARGLVVFTPE